MGIIHIPEKKKMITREMYEKYENEFFYLYCAKILYPITWSELECSPLMRSIGKIMMTSNDEQLNAFKDMISNPLQYIRKDAITENGLFATISSNHISISFRVTPIGVPDFTRFGINNHMCLFPGKDATDETKRAENYLRWIMEQLQTPKYMNLVKLEVLVLTIR